MIALLDTSEDLGMAYSVNYPKKPIDHKKWSMWLRDAREWAADKGITRVPEATYRALFDKGVAASDVVEALSKLG